MQIFLSPLFLLQRFCKHCLRIYYKDNPDKWVWQHELAKLPPLGAFEKGTGFNPDFPLLIMFDEFAIDGEAYEYIQSPKRKSWLGTWPEVVDLLKSEGALSTIDTGNEIKKVSHLRGQMLRMDMKEPSKWSEAMMYHDTLLFSADKALGTNPFSANSLVWNFNAKNAPGVKGSDGHYHLLSGLPLTNPGENREDPHFQLHNIALGELTSQLKEINGGLAIASHLKVAPMFWAPYKLYLEKKSSDTALNHGEASKLFFKIAFPKYKPNTIKEFSRLRKDKRLRQLREEILRAAQSGNVLDTRYPQTVLEEVLQVEKKISRVRQITGWLSSAIGSVPLPGIGIASTLVGEFISYAAEKNIKKNWNWFYLISNGSGHS